MPKSLDFVIGCDVDVCLIYPMISRYCPILWLSFMLKNSDFVVSEIGVL